LLTAFYGEVETARRGKTPQREGPE
jgi:hypothetical protein